MREVMGEEVPLPPIIPPKAEPENPEHAKIGPVRVAPIRVEPVQVAPVKEEPVWVAPVKIEPAQAELVKEELIDEPDDDHLYWAAFDD